MTAAEPDIFFKQKRTTSEIKDSILPAYFKTWYNIQVNGPGSQSVKSLLFIDGNAGEGVTPAGQPAAPLNILENIQAADDAPPLVKTFFINPTGAFADKLTANLAQLPFYPELPEAPVVLTEAAFQEQIENISTNNQPALIFLDPSRQGLTRQFLLRAQQSSETDVLLVANFNKIYQALLSPEPGSWENTFWGNRLSEVINISRHEPSARKREVLFMQALAAILQEAGFYIFRFNILAPGKNSASQYLMLLTKSLPGYLGMKEMMQAYSDYQEDGVPLFAATNKPPVPLLPGFFRYLSNYTLDNLVAALAQSRSQFHYKTLQAIYEEHSIGTNYIKANYQQALEKLQADGVLYPVNAQNKKVKAITDTSVIFYNLHRSKK
ncbi:three-Cys-motif partner protein TcmP [Adhaeribacter rhizoryzae]|uniref:Three-Cys-motif partner protein TcmP n=1 Tax=Adhaeribacter rhizoryzae TaxID=2607907 RepID=A0A5M6DM83_9BACT|nr:three-Cys-motif partner protein TcmP [Adhaeribacter rhizoryzae]KAA5548654.1 three-Cys-motif partner protein TcmP [Adhaeribacter rhizoryzae]